MCLDLSHFSCPFGFVFLLLIFDRSQIKRDLSSFHSGLFVHGTVFRAGLNEPLYHLVTPVLMCHLTPFEPEADTHLVSFGKELLRTADLCIEVVSLDPAGQLHLFDLHGLLLLAVLFFLLITLVAVLAVVEDAADRRLRLGCDEHQIQPLIVCEFFCPFKLRDAHGVIVLVKETDFGSFYVIVDEQVFSADSRHLQKQNKKCAKRTPHTSIARSWTDLLTRTAARQGESGCSASFYSVILPRFGADVKGFFNFFIFFGF